VCPCGSRTALAADVHRSPLRGIHERDAFSPRDATPLTKWATVLMMVESAASLLLAIMVIASGQHPSLIIR
jgi:hypothetical protein